MKSKYAMLLMANVYKPEVHQACFETEKQITYICTVKNFDEACNKVKQLQSEGVGAIELCGAFGAEKAKQLMELTQNKVAIGYVTHEKEQDTLHETFFENFEE